MEKLKKELDSRIAKLANATDFREKLESLESIYPFNEFEYVISTLFGRNLLTLDEYLQIRDEYIARNMFLYIFEINAPRTFGETWAHGQLKGLVPSLEKPTRKLDSSYSAGEYDFFLFLSENKGVRIEVKASRAVDAEYDGPLCVRALASDSNRPFKMNFQQIKPICCDVFIWLAVWRDTICYWVLSGDEVQSHPNFSYGQHRGNFGEGQLHIREDNIHDFDKFLVQPDKLLSAIQAAYKRQISSAK